MPTEYEVIEPATFLEGRKYRIAFCCDQCGHKWKRTFKAIPIGDPPCPNKRCQADREIAQLREETARLRIMLDEQRAPAQIGNNNLNRAWDVTQEIVAKDNQVTNLNDRPYEGESMAPKLPPKLQVAADNFFGGAKGHVIGNSQQATVRQNIMKRLSQRAIAGAYRGMAVPPNAVTPGASRGQPPLVSVRKETIRR